MLVKNLTKSVLRLRNGVTVLELPPNKIVEVDAVKFPATTIKNVYGKYVQIMAMEDAKADEVKEDVSEKANENMEPKEGNGELPQTEEAGTKDSEGEDAGDEAGNNDDGVAKSDADTDGDKSEGTEVPEEPETTADGDKEGEDKAEPKKAAKTAKTAGKKAAKAKN